MLYQTINPYTEEVVETFPSHTDADLESIIAKAEKTYATDWRLRPLAARKAVLKKAAAAVGNGIHDRTNEITTNARRGPVGAFIAATGVGFLVGLCLARGSRATRTSEWPSQLNSRRSVLGRRTASGWRTLLRLE